MPGGGPGVGVGVGGSGSGSAEAGVEVRRNREARRASRAAFQGHRACNSLPLFTYGLTVRFIIAGKRVRRKGEGLSLIPRLERDQDAASWPGPPL